MSKNRGIAIVFGIFQEDEKYSTFLFWLKSECWKDVFVVRKSKLDFNFEYLWVSLIHLLYNLQRMAEWALLQIHNIPTVLGFSSIVIMLCMPVG